MNAVDLNRNGMLLPATLLCLLFLCACSATQQAATDAAFAARLVEGTQLKNQKTAPELDAQNHIASIYLGSRSIPLKTTTVLPEVFSQVRRYQYPGQVFSVEKAAALISAETGVLIRVADDVHAASALSGATMSKSAGASLRPPLPALSAAGGMAGGSARSDSIVLNAERSLAGMLNLLCTQAGLHWEYRNGVVVIERMVSRTFQLKVQAGTRQFDTSNAKSGSSQAKTESNGTGAITTGISSTATVTTSSGKVTAMDTVVELIRSVLSPAGRVIPNAATGSILVFDTIDGVEHAEKIVNRENELLNRFTKIHIAIYTFEQLETDERGVDWNVLFKNKGKLDSVITSPATLSNELGGSIRFGIINSATSNSGQFDGTSALIKLLNENGKTHAVFDQVIEARNRVATAASATVQKVYLAETTPAPASASGATGGAVGLTPGTITTGLDLQLQPNIYDSGHMSLLFSLGLLDLLDIKTITSGTGSNESSIQGPETKGYNFQQDVPLRVGETTFITGYEATLDSYTRRALDRTAPLLAGGSFTGDSANQKLFIFITPVSIGTTY